MLGLFVIFAAVWALHLTFLLALLARQRSIDARLALLASSARDASSNPARPLRFSLAWLGYLLFASMLGLHLWTWFVARSALVWLIMAYSIVVLLHVSYLLIVSARQRKLETEIDALGEMMRQTRQIARG